MSQPPAALPSLGSLSQSARSKQLKSARAILILIGVLSLLANVAFAVAAEYLVDEELKKQLVAEGIADADVDPEKYAEIRTAAIRLTVLVNAAGAALGAVFIALGIMVHRKPVAITVTGLVLYVAANLAFGLLDPTMFVRGIIIKIIFVFALAKSISAAVAYQKAQAAPPQPATF